MVEFEGIYLLSLFLDHKSVYNETVDNFSLVKMTHFNYYLPLKYRIYIIFFC